MLLEVVDQTPLLNLVAQRVQVVHHVIPAVNAHARNRYIHVGGLKREASHKRAEDLDHCTAVREGFVCHLLQLADDVSALFFEAINYTLDDDGFLFNVLVKLFVELLLESEKDGVLVHWDLLLVVGLLEGLGTECHLVLGRLFEIGFAHVLIWRVQARHKSRRVQPYLRLLLLKLKEVGLGLLHLLLRWLWEAALGRARLERAARAATVSIAGTRLLVLGLVGARVHLVRVLRGKRSWLPSILRLLLRIMLLKRLKMRLLLHLLRVVVLARVVLVD